jgi:hypothetical protein
LSITILLRIDPHTTKLDDSKNSAAAANSLLFVKDRPFRCRPYGGCYDRQHGCCQGQQACRQREIDEPLPRSPTPVEMVMAPQDKAINGLLMQN